MQSIKVSPENKISWRVTTMLPFLVLENIYKVLGNFMDKMKETLNIDQHSTLNWNGFRVT